VPGGVLPDPACTPGATNSAVTRATIATTICRSGYTKTIRPPASYTGALKRVAGQRAVPDASGEVVIDVPEVHVQACPEAGVKQALSTRSFGQMVWAQSVLSPAA